MSVSINLNTNEITVSFEPSATTNDPIGQKIQGAKRGLERLLAARREVSADNAALLALAGQLETLCHSAATELDEKKADNLTTLAGIESALTQLRQAVQILGTPGANEQKIAAEAAAHVGRINAERDAKIAALATILK